MNLSASETKALLEEGLSALGLVYTDEQIRLLSEYLRRIEEANTKHSFVGAEGRDLVVKHILDSLAPIDGIRRLLPASCEATLADLGSGAGLPGIPLAVMLPDVHFVLIDRMKKRADFLRAITTDFALSNIEVVEQQAEHIKTSFDVVTFRAFRPFEPKLFKKIFSLCKKGGHVAAYKGKREKAESELLLLKGLYKSAYIEPVTVPFLSDERCFVVIRP